MGNSWRGKVTPEEDRDSPILKHTSLLHAQIMWGRRTIPFYWEGGRLPAKELNYKKRGIRGAIAIQKVGAEMIN